MEEHVKLCKKISIIVPVYNTAKYLPKCVDSILMQTLQEIEVICVDDGSTDDSSQILEKYADKDNRVRVIHKENGGLVSAKKAGIQIADAPYIGFVDSDDWIEPDYLKKMLQAQRDTGADMIVSSHFHDIGDDSRIISSDFSAGLYSREQLLPTLIYSGRFFEYGLQPHMVTKLFRREILMKTQLCVDERIVIGEDAAVVYPSILEAEKVYISDICGYHYVQHSNSMTKKKAQNEEEMCNLLLCHLERAFREKGVWDIMEPQMEQYRKYLLLMRQMQCFDDRVALPYGGIPKTSRIVIYGAGVLGQKLHGYLSGIEGMDIALWVDKNDAEYRKKGMEVRHPKDILTLAHYDYILIANTVQKTADAIRKYLMEMGIAENKILWLSNAFIGRGE